MEVAGEGAAVRREAPCGITADRSRTLDLTPFVSIGNLRPLRPTARIRPLPGGDMRYSRRTILVNPAMTSNPKIQPTAFAVHVNNATEMPFVVSGVQ
jgi:hypothetical protein